MTKLRIIDWRAERVSAVTELGLTRLVAEVDETGVVERELGFDRLGRLVHRYPGGIGIAGDYGVFEMASFEPSAANDLSSDEFARLWAMPDAMVEGSHRRRWLTQVCITLVGLALLWAAIILTR